MEGHGRSQKRLKTKVFSPLLCDIFFVMCEECFSGENGLAWLVGSTTLRRLKFFLVAPRTPYFDILWSKPSNSQKNVTEKWGKNSAF